MVDSLANPKIEAEMSKVKEAIESVKKAQGVFTNTFPTMKPRQRAEMIRLIMGQHRMISDFIVAARKYDLRAPALKFGLENIKQKYQMLMTLWRRTEKMMDKGGPGSGGGGSISSTEKMEGLEPIGSPTRQAVEDYANALQTMGHTPTKEMINEFRDRLDSAYQKAKDKSGGRDLAVRVVNEGGKIKVKMEPK
jgi:hypothetical protein